MLDRRKLAAPLAAQAVAFVVVLVIGVFMGHTSKPAPGPTSTGTSKATARSASATPGEGALVKLIVSVKQLTSLGVDLPGVPGVPGLPDLQGSQVSVLQDGNLASVASGKLDTHLEYAPDVPAGGQYQVCVKPPAGWTSTARDTYSLGDWTCTTKDVGTAPAAVTFQLRFRSGQVSP